MLCQLHTVKGCAIAQNAEGIASGYLGKWGARGVRPGREEGEDGRRKTGGGPRGPGLHGLSRPKARAQWGCTRYGIRPNRFSRTVY